MEIKFSLFTVLKKKDGKTFESGLIRGYWKKGSIVPRFQDMEKIGFQKYTDITTLEQIRNPGNFLNMKAYLEFIRREKGIQNEMSQGFLYRMIEYHLNIEKAFVHAEHSQVKIKKG